ncbi:hypothetical protein C8Q77DRAFT_1156913 [Trametes polyzona]|nr:hypothetical protein C8Q77DRAFT_1156913 [Trametes polyzona]
MLTRMPKLQVVSFTLESIYAHGLPWSVVQTLLSLPHLRELSLHFLHIAPSLQQGEELALASCAPLTTFYLSLPDGRYTGACSPSEREALALILRLTCNSLEHLTLPSDEAPVQEMFTTMEWPHLRTLHLRGESLSVGSPPIPYVSLFARMPHLQRLELELGQPIGVNPRPFWPRGFVADWPLPKLRHLTLSSPQVDDLIYTALPTSLRSLTLRYAPHYITNVMKEVDGYIRKDRRWRWPLLRSSEVLEILCLCLLPSLEHLELEYRADDAESELLSFLGGAFPNLTSLVMLRYRSHHELTVPLKSITGAISSLAHLQTLSFHADLPETPVRQSVPGYKGRTNYCYQYDDVQKFVAAAQSVADAIARVSPASLETIRIWAPSDNTHRATRMLVFGVVRQEEVAARAEILGGERVRVWLSRPSALCFC